MYHSLTAARTLPTPFISGFIHVPANLQATSCVETERGAECVLTWSAAVAGGLEIIAACLETADPVVTV
jgi:pyrrolidone-carboxylate peptidase